MQQVSILLLNYNGKKFNKDCITSILAQSYQHFEILFIDNASSDSSVAEVEALFTNEIEKKKIRIIKNEKNEGFANGNNIGHKLADPKSKYICMLNNDTTVDVHWLKELVEVIEKDGNIGAVGSMVLDKGYEEQIKQIVLQEKKIWDLTIIGETSIRQALPYDESLKTYYTTILSGCAYLYRKDITDYPFPERYFAYGEDVFLCFYILSL